MAANSSNKRKAEWFFMAEGKNRSLNETLRPYWKRTVDWQSLRRVIIAAVEKPKAKGGKDLF